MFVDASAETSSNFHHALVFSGEYDLLRVTDYGSFGLKAFYMIVDLGGGRTRVRAHGEKKHNTVTSHRLHKQAKFTVEMKIFQMRFKPETLRCVIV